MTAEREIHRRIEARGAITFAEFMELALYWPKGGYYTGTSGKVGGAGDYYTSPMVHPAFGALVSVQLFQMWRLLGCPAPFQVVELGAGNGMLCRDIVTYSQNLPGRFAESLRYLCLDIGANAGFERDFLGQDATHRVSRLTANVPGESFTAGTGGLPLRNLHGCILANELLDAFPVHQVVFQDGKLQETYVTLDHGDLSMVPGALSTPELAGRLDALGVTLEEGQTVEINLGLAGWSRSLTDALSAGFVLIVDYGRQARELYSAAARKRGTLTAFYRHTQTDAPLQYLGVQDITAQVDFTTVAEEGRRAGLAPLGLTTQGRFLSNLGWHLWQRRLATLGLSQREVEANRAGMVDLARPGGLGEFKVLAQGKNVDTAGLWGFQPPVEPALLERLPVPLLTPQHLSLMEARYPHTAFEAEEWWAGGADLK